MERQENGGKLQMQTQELELARGPISRRPPNREPAQGRESRTGFNPAVAGKCNRAEGPERGQGAGGLKARHGEGQWLRGSGVRSQGSGEGTDKRAEDNWTWHEDAHSLGCDCVR